jgi:glutamate-5-semialdehyde dehydrogenase
MTASVQPEITDIAAYCDQLAEQATTARRALISTTPAQRRDVLMTAARLMESQVDQLVAANEEDLARADELGLTGAMVDRLRIDPQRVSKMAEALRQIAEQTDPVGQIIEGSVRPNGLRIEKVRVPIGVVLIIFESRPNVTCDAAALCIKSGNVAILRGGKEAVASNNAIAEIMRQALAEHQLNPDMVQLVQTTDRAAVGHLLKMVGRVDLAIPRGGESLIRAVVEQAHIPVIKHYTGNCHVYVDGAADQLPGRTAQDICVNAKVQRPGVCNAAETLLFHEDAGPIMVETCKSLADAGVELRVCQRTAELLGDAVACDRLKRATDEDWATEYLDLIVAVRTVESLDQAIEHINRYGSRHTDAIVTADVYAADRFVAEVDSADVMVNCSTRFSDGGEYGLGAEIGISTDKLHARGPMGAADLTTYKWVVRGHGQIRT